MDAATKRRQALFLFLALVSSFFTISLYYRGSAWLIPALVSYVAAGIVLVRGNRRIFLIPLTKRRDPIAREDRAEIRAAAASLAAQLCERLAPRGDTVIAVHGGTVEIAPAEGGPDRRIELHVRDVADVEVAFVVPERPGSPFEQILGGPADRADSVVAEAVDFVCDLVAERLVLAWDARPLRGGRRFLAAADLTPATLRDLAWIVSWHGARDWRREDANDRSSA